MRKPFRAGSITPSVVFHIPLALYRSEAVDAPLVSLKRWQWVLGLSTVKRVIPIGAIVMLGVCSAMLAGCASASVADVASTNTSRPRPTEILVDVQPALKAGNPNAEVAANVSGKLQAALIKKLTRAGVTAEAFAPVTARAGAATLHVTITGANPGNIAERILIGFGVGQAKLQASAEFETDQGALDQSMTKFVISSDSGSKPGMILPGGVAAATGDVIHLAIGGGIKLATDVHGGMSVVVDKTTTAIVGQIEKYYEHVGWIWPKHV